MTFNAKIGVFMDFFWRFRAATQVYIIHRLLLCALRYDCNKGVVFYPKFPQI